jgi:hypothetical protein
MSTNFISSMSLTPDFGNVISNSVSGEFVIITRPPAIAGNAFFDNINLSTVPRGQLWFSLPNVFNCSYANISAGFNTICGVTFSENLSKISVVKFNGTDNTSESWVPFFNFTVNGTTTNCDVGFAFFAEI